MEGTDVYTGKKDDNRTHDHTYYGNGCPNQWKADVQYNNGSTVSCSSRLATTADDQAETQKIGTYYTFQAATSGSGGNLNTNNANVSDTFCPLGWQLPYSGTGGDYYDKSRSWRYLSSIYGFTTSTPRKRYPMDHILSGLYSQSGAVLFDYTKNGILWSATSKSEASSYFFGVLATDTVGSNIKSDSYPIRCVFKLST